MRYFLAFLIICGIYLYVFRNNPARPAVPVAQATPSPSGDFIKRPLDRTHAVLDQVRTQRDSNDF